MAKADVSQSQVAALKTQSSTVLYHNAQTGLRIAQTAECNAFIRDKIVPTAISNRDIEKCHICYATKNTKTEEFVSELLNQLQQEKCLVLFAYGPHIQRAVTILELVKTRAGTETLQQTNTLERFVNVVPGRNELLDRKLNVPILVAVICRKK
ncbi:LAME_0A06656g1_1 [Lachancea meyersii CBS 8951]|uniref:LAME_0A06656g1_1 n=1 Tax=Lachancea meyersii CBS 8951 TaxID=1266667 RepID=A0A1G4IQC9_9SACH|nr:LAME_0A06656g1_1 [Lachancea meyersii CBS 8951]